MLGLLRDKLAMYLIPKGFVKIQNSHIESSDETKVIYKDLIHLQYLQFYNPYYKYVGPSPHYKCESMY